MAVQFKGERDERFECSSLQNRCVAVELMAAFRQVVAAHDIRILLVLARQLDKPIEDRHDQWILGDYALFENLPKAKAECGIVTGIPVVKASDG